MNITRHNISTSNKKKTKLQWTPPGCARLLGSGRGGRTTRTVSPRASRRWSASQRWTPATSPSTSTLSVRSFKPFCCKASCQAALLWWKRETFGVLLFAVQSSISVYLGFRFSLPSAIIFPFLPHSSKIHPPTQLLPFLSGGIRRTNQQQRSKNE